MPYLPSSGVLTPTRFSFRSQPIDPQRQFSMDLMQDALDVLSDLEESRIDRAQGKALIALIEGALPLVQHREKSAAFDAKELGFDALEDVAYGAALHPLQVRDALRGYLVSLVSYLPPSDRCKTNDCAPARRDHEKRLNAIPSVQKALKSQK